MDGECLDPSGCTLHPNRENFLFGGAILSTSGCTLHPYKKIFLMDGAFESDKLLQTIRFSRNRNWMDSSWLTCFKHNRKTTSSPIAVSLTQ